MKKCPHCGAPLDNKGHCAQCGGNYPLKMKAPKSVKLKPKQKATVAQRLMQKRSGSK